MQFLYMGTGAAEGIPGIFCNCDVCRRALQAGKRNIMTRSQALIDGKLLVDFGPDMYMHFLRAGQTLWNIENILVTHSHSDHFLRSEMGLRKNGFAYKKSAEKVNIYTSRDVIEKLYGINDPLLPFGKEEIGQVYNFIPMEYFKTVDVGGYAVTPLPSRHGPQEEQTFLFLIEKGKSAVFYGNDTGVFGEEIDEFLAERGKKLTLLSLDCNKGDKSENYDTHMSMRENKTIAERFAAKGITDENTKIYVTHFSHNCGMIYDELCKAAEKYGFTVAYDGLTLEV